MNVIDTPLDLAIWLDVSAETVSDRIASRLQCQCCGFTTSVSSAKFAERPICPYCDGPLVRRNDDDARVLQNRLEEFNAKTQPLAALYEKMSVLRRIDGNRDREAVFADISRLIEQAPHDSDQDRQGDREDAASVPHGE